MQSVKTLARLFFLQRKRGRHMENFIKEHDYVILVYAKEDTAKYTAAIKALTETKKMSGWDRVQGVTIHKDCRIPSLYHGEDLAIVMERDNGSGQYSIRIMS
nr:MAG TPA: hypothetical protein [Caudoviricetes sp.]